MTVKLCMDWSRMFLSLAFRLHNLQLLSCLIYGIWKGRDFTSWSIWKGREFRHFGPWKGPKGLTCILWKSQEKRSGLRFMHILKRVQLQQLKGMWRFKLGIWKGCHLPIEDMQFVPTVVYESRNWTLRKTSPYKTLLSTPLIIRRETNVHGRNERHRLIMHKCIIKVE